MLNTKKSACLQKLMQKNKKKRRETPANVIFFLPHFQLAKATVYWRDNVMHRIKDGLAAYKKK